LGDRLIRWACFSGGKGRRCGAQCGALPGAGGQGNRDEAAEKLMDALERALTPEQQAELLRQLEEAADLQKLGPQALIAALSKIQGTPLSGPQGTGSPQETPAAAQASGAGAPASGDQSGILGPTGTLGGTRSRERSSPAGEVDRVGTLRDDKGGAGGRGGGTAGGEDGRWERGEPKQAIPDAVLGPLEQVARHEDSYGYFDEGDPGPEMLDASLLEGAVPWPIPFHCLLWNGLPTSLLTHSF
jgi:hypothetical protein